MVLEDLMLLNPGECFMKLLVSDFHDKVPLSQSDARISVVVTIVSEKSLTKILLTN